MRFWKKICLTLGVFLIANNAVAHFSTLVVFGDSLSDIGNFPEPPQIYWHPKAPKILSNAIPQYYVPFANPVKWPTLQTAFLADQTKINGKTRKYRSVGWTQFLIQAATHAKESESDLIVPAYLSHTTPLPANTSLNYAWGYATSFSGCVNPYYIATQCDTTSIKQARMTYVQHPTTENYQKLQVPGLSQQIQTFLTDKKDQKIQTNHQTTYVIWIGGNDLIVAAIALQKQYNPLPAMTLMLGGTARRIIENTHLLLNALPKTERPSHLYLFETFDPRLTPAFYHTPLGEFGNIVVHCANFFLKMQVTLFNLFSSHTKLIIVPIHTWYQNAATQAAFQKTMGKACQFSGGDYNDVTHIPSHHCEHFLFWNDVHPATPVQNQVATLFLAQLKHWIAT